MSQAQLVKNWTITPNIRRAYVSLNDLAGWWIFQNHTLMLAVGWTVKFTCDGTTGPTGPSDTTNRLTTQAACQTRGAAAGNPQSYTVLQNVDGVQILIAYQGATDDVIRVSYSPGGLYTLAAPSTNQPTATDEIVLTTGTTVVSNGVGGDRVMTVWCSNDTTIWRNITFRQGSTIQRLGVDKVVNLCATGVLSPPYMAYRHTAFDRNSTFTGAGINYNPINTSPGTAGWLGTTARVVTALVSRIIRLGAGSIEIAGAADGFTRAVLNTFASNAPALQNALGSAMLPIVLVGEKTANLEGFFGYPIDWWMSYTAASNIPSFGNFMPGYDPGDTIGVTPVRANWWVCLGASDVHPWRNVASTIQTT